jgi:hypothetical protein
MTNFKPYSKAKKKAVRDTKKRLLTAEQQLSAVAARVEREDSLVYLDDQYITTLRNMADVLSAVRKGIK